ncbi:Rv3654c family TadE-like protein [Streptomyces sp. NPDC057287]|uniref:Rv3654c family TadE-like protein n=1 Tax=Streptomyces sp. NPDC057287 TaxID=3346086 RepID=UPI00363BD6A4
MRRWKGGTGDQGLATVWAAVTTATLCAVFAVVLALGQAVAARHSAGGAADLAALAAADQALRGAETACRVASEVAGAQGAQIVRCAVRGEVADVTARVCFGPYALEVRSRAGPAEVPLPTPLPEGPASSGERERWDGLNPQGLAGAAPGGFPAWSFRLGPVELT